MKPLAVLFLLVMVALGCAQSEGFRKTGSKKVAAADAAAKKQGLVTATEARAIFQRSDAYMRKALKLKPRVYDPGFVGSSSPVKRVAVLVGLEKLFAEYESSMQRLPKPIAYDTARVVPAMRNANADRLIRLRLISPLGPLATSTRDELSISEFGDIMSVALVRILDLLHISTSKFSPEMMREGG